MTETTHFPKDSYDRSGGADKYTSVTLSPECRGEIDAVVAATGATRSTIHETIREFVEAAIKGRILPLYLERVGRRAGALNGGAPPQPQPNKLVQPVRRKPAAAPPENTQQGDT